MLRPETDDAELVNAPAPDEVGHARYLRDEGSKTSWQVDPPGNEQGPGGESEALSMSLVGDESSLEPTNDILSDLDAYADALRGYLVVQVVIDDAGHRRTTIYRSAAAAERAVQRAKARGRFAHVSLCQLLPVGVVAGLGGGVG